MYKPQALNTFKKTTVHQFALDQDETNFACWFIGTWDQSKTSAIAGWEDNGTEYYGSWVEMIYLLATSVGRNYWDFHENKMAAPFKVLQV